MARSYYQAYQLATGKTAAAAERSRRRRQGSQSGEGIDQLGGRRRTRAGAPKGGHVSWFGDALRHNPELAIFLTLAVGFFIGRLKFGGFSLGTVVGTLLAGVLVGQLGIQVPPLVKTVFFDLFLFTTGYKVGPQFFRGLKKDALSQVMLTVVLCVTCLLTAFVASKLLGLRPGHGRRAPGRGVLGVDGDRDRRRGDQRLAIPVRKRPRWSTTSPSPTR